MPLIFSKPREKPLTVKQSETDRLIDEDFYESQEVNLIEAYNIINELQISNKSTYFKTEYVILSFEYDGEGNFYVEIDDFRSSFWAYVPLNKEIAKNIIQKAFLNEQFDNSVYEIGDPKHIT